MSKRKNSWMDENRRHGTEPGQLFSTALLREAIWSITDFALMATQTFEALCSGVFINFRVRGAFTRAQVVAIHRTGTGEVAVTLQTADDVLYVLRLPDE